MNESINPFPHSSLLPRHAQTVRDSSSSHKKDYVIVPKNFLNPEGHQKRISGSKVTAILLKGWILPLGVVAWGRFCACLEATYKFGIYIGFCIYI